jgi:hypothetical protein
MNARDERFLASGLNVFGAAPMPPGLASGLAVVAADGQACGVEWDRDDTFLRADRVAG